MKTLAITVMAAVLLVGCNTQSEVETQVETQVFDPVEFKQNLSAYNLGVSDQLQKDIEGFNAMVEDGEITVNDNNTQPIIPQNENEE